jgi:ribosome modulation factor
MKTAAEINQEGYEAFYAGEKQEDNPYTDEHEYVLWESGWQTAKELHEDFLETI